VFVSIEPKKKFPLFNWGGGAGQKKYIGLKERSPKPEKLAST